jgi:hypothetical protein
MAQKKFVCGAKKTGAGLFAKHPAPSCSFGNLHQRVHSTRHQKVVTLRSSLHHQNARWANACITRVPIIAFAQTLWLKHVTLAMGVFMWQAVLTIHGVIMLPTQDII